MDTAEITVGQVTTYCRRARRINVLTQRNKELKENEIMPALLSGASLPTNGPYEIELAQNGGTKLDWQEEYEDLMTKYLVLKNGYKGKAARALARDKMKAMKDNAEPKDSVTVNGKDYVGGVKFNVRVSSAKVVSEAA